MRCGTTPQPQRSSCRPAARSTASAGFRCRKPGDGRHGAGHGRTHEHELIRIRPFDCMWKRTDDVSLFTWARSCRTPPGDFAQRPLAITALLQVREHTAPVAVGAFLPSLNFPSRALHLHAEGRDPAHHCATRLQSSGSFDRSCTRRRRRRACELGDQPRQQLARLPFVGDRPRPALRHARTEKFHVGVTSVCATTSGDVALRAAKHDDGGLPAVERGGCGILR